MLLSQCYDLLGQLSFDTQDGAGLSCFVLIFGQADLLSFAFLFSQKEVWLGRLGAKFFEMNGTDSDRILVLHSVLFFFFLMLFSILRCTTLIPLMPALNRLVEGGKRWLEL